MTKNGLVADVDGWFVVNARESRWRDEGLLGVYCTFEGKRRFRQLGFNVSVLEAGQALGMYFHSPPGTEHVIVGSGQSPAVVVAVGARGRGGVVYPESKVAARFGASVEHETRNPTEAYAEVYADLPRSHWVKYREGWLPDD
jgi:hypothetical protein